MSASKEIRGKIKSVTSTRKITTAMEMVSASKMRRAQEQMLALRPYAQKMKVLVHHLVQADMEGDDHPYVSGHASLSAPPGFILVSTDKGLCGGLNVIMFRSFLKYLADHHLSLKDCPAGTIGARGYSFLKRLGGRVVAHMPLIGHERSFVPILGVTRSLLSLYDKK